MNNEYTYRKIFRSKEYKVTLNDNKLVNNEKEYSINEINKIVFTDSARPSMKIFTRGDSFIINSASFDDKGKPITQWKEYSSFIELLINKLGHSVVIQRSSWMYFSLQLISTLVFLIVSIVMSIIAYNSYQDVGLVRKFYFHALYAVIPLAVSIVGFLIMRKPTILTKELALKSIHKG